MAFDVKLLRHTAVAKHDDYRIGDIARRLGVPPANVSRWATGHSVPSGPALAAIERAYGITAAQLFPADA
jgi:transcriptional regulator with XRE-family HTH domain